jgi:hypothetical protein
MKRAGKNPLRRVISRRPFAGASNGRLTPDLHRSARGGPHEPDAQPPGSPGPPAGQRPGIGAAHLDADPFGQRHDRDDDLAMHRVGHAQVQAGSGARLQAQLHQPRPA